MKHRRGFCGISFIIAGLSSAVLMGSCRGRDASDPDASPVVLRVGISQLSLTNPTAGVRQLSQNLSVENLARLTEDGRVEPQIAEKWTLTDGGRSLRVTLKPGLKFHDGTPVTSQTVAAILPDALQATLGPVMDDIDHVRAADSNSIDIGFRHPSPLLLESLEVPIKKPGSTVLATGPFEVVPDSKTELRANPDYTLGRPHIDEIRLQTFPSVRTAWAELLRNNIDMLYEVGPDALDSLESSTSVAVFRFTRRYQYTIAFNSAAPALHASAVRRALNLAIDRVQLVQKALAQHGVPSSGPIWPKYWALENSAPSFEYDPQGAAKLLNNKSIRFTCLIPSDATYELIALELKRQLALVNIDMEVRAVSQDEMFEAQKNRKYEAVLVEAISGPTLLRPYQRWHSAGAVNAGAQGNATIDAAFDRVRGAETEQNYRQAVTGLRQAFIDDPPAIFLAWSERARAVSKRFSVPTVEPDRDILGTLRLWKPSGVPQLTSRN